MAAGRVLQERGTCTMSNQNHRDSLLFVVLGVLAVVVLSPLLMMLFLMPMMGWWGGFGMGFSPLWGLGMMLLLLAVLVALGYFLYRGVAGSRVLDNDRALEELRTAYARGDLSDEEFEKRRKRLQRDREQ